MSKEEDIIQELKAENERLLSLLEDSFTPVCWPKSQKLMDLDGFDENATLINDDEGLENYGSSAYFVNSKWLSQQ